METNHRILQVFNRYLQHGGEEDIVMQLSEELGRTHEFANCFFDSADWKGENGPSALRQAMMLFYNRKSGSILTEAIKAFRPDCLLLHNLYPVGSPSLYHTALKNKVPVIQYIHNFRPFSVGGTLWAKGQLCAESLTGNYLKEIRRGAWQNSISKSLLFAIMLKYLHASGWLRAVKGWIAISEFMRQKFIEAGVDPSRVETLMHSWEPRTPAGEVTEDQGYYLFLGRLVEEKGIGVLIDAWDILADELGAETPRLVVCGTGEMAARVERASERNTHIRYEGFVAGERKVSVLRGCRAMLAPSTWWEPLGLVTYEAYDFKKPMLAADSGGLAETVSHGVTGLLHERGNARALAADVMACEKLGSKGRAEMGQAGRRWLEAEANPARWRQSFDRILRKLVD